MHRKIRRFFSKFKKCTVFIVAIAFTLLFMISILMNLKLYSMFYRSSRAQESLKMNQNPKAMNMNSFNAPPSPQVRKFKRARPPNHQTAHRKIPKSDVGRLKYPPRVDMGRCPAYYGKVTILVLYNDNINK